jgi:type IV secretory pathway TraG/TraD family ATPase VirD4
MNGTARRVEGPHGQGEALLMIGAATVAALAVGVIAGAAHLASLVTGAHERLAGDPVVLVVDLARHRTRWPADATAIAVGLAVLLVMVAGGVTWLIARRGGGGNVDHAARWMGRGRDLHRLTERHHRSEAKRLGVQAPGLPVGRAVAGSTQLYAGWEDVCVDIWGPRSGKTTSRAIPTILAAPGAVVATSNKRDVVDATRDPRAETGRVWVFDPQEICDEPPSWTWNPLSYVTDEVKAAELADVFAMASRDPGARTDAYFDTAAQNLVAQLLLAAALDTRPLTQVYLWLTDPNDNEPVEVLSEHGYDVLAAALLSQVNAPEKQRGGVYGTAQEMCAFMTQRQAMRWVEVTDARARFAPAAFASSTDTLYSLSKEGKGSCAPLVTALTLAVCEAAEELAKRSSQGRLPVPMVACLDEAANVTPIRQLPAYYSHWGSRGICVLTILQSWSQGVEVWGRDGMNKLWSAATVKCCGSGVSEVEFLDGLSRLIGDFDLQTRSVTYSGGAGGRSVGHQVRRERILDVAALTALPRGRMVVLSSGSRPTLARAIPWMEGPDAGRVFASIAAHDPDAKQTIARTHAYDDATTEAAR